MNQSFKTTGLLLGTALFAASSAFAQEAETESRQQTVMVTATPIRDSQQAAIEAKRDAPNVVDIISADTIGRFPDQNLADSLGRLPGLAIERDQGQARYINFRGAPFRYTAIAFDGIDVPGAQNGRIPRFDSFPSVITSAVEANKAITPDMPGEAVSGFINVKTFSPFDAEGFSASLEAGYGEQELGGGPVNKYNGRLSWSNDKVGFVVFGSNNRRVQNTDNREMDLELDASGELIVNELDFRSYFVEREDNAYGGKVEFRPGGAVERIFASTLFTEFIDNEERNQYVFDFAGGAGAIGSAVAPGEAGYQPLVLVTRALEDGRYDNSTFTNTLGMDFTLADWFVEARLNYTETEDNTFLPLPYSAGGTVAASYDLSDVQAPEVTVYDTFTQTPRSLLGIDYAAILGLVIDASLDNEAWKFKLDGERETDLFGGTVLKAGIQYDSREASGHSFAQSPGLFPSGIDIDQYSTNVAWYSDFNNTIGATYYRNTDLRADWAELVGGLSASISDDLLIGIEEDIIAGYAMATTGFDGGNLVYGARVEMTDYTSSGPAIAGGAYSDDYVNFLPSAHLNLDLNDTMKLRFSASTGLSRPTYNELRGSALVDFTDQSVTGGNPTLDAEKTWGGDVSFEWYYAPASIFSAGLFYRHVDDVIYASTSTIDGGIYLDTAAGQDWDYTGFVNGKSGHLSGLELNFIGQAADLLPEPLDGFGVSGNLTVLDSEFETNEGATYSLPGTSDLIWNASVYYEKFGLSARLNYQYRDAWLSTTENDGLAEYWDEQQRVDASIRYSLPWQVQGAQFTLFANGNNLTDEIDVRYSGTVATPNQVEGYGRRWLLGLRVDY